MNLRGYCAYAFEWVTRNGDADSRHDQIMHITSLPLDPLAKDFGKRINVIEPGEAEPASDNTPEPSSQGTLWSD